MRGTFINHATLLVQHGGVNRLADPIWPERASPFSPVGPHFAGIRGRLGPPRLGVLPIGAYEPAWFMSGVHQSPAEAVQAADALGAATSIGMHFGTFALADDGQDDPPRALEAALKAHP